MVEAIRLLNQGVEVQQAITLLEEAKRTAPQGRLDEIDEGWLTVAQAMGHLQAGRLSEAEHLLRMTPPVLRQAPVVARLQAELLGAAGGGPRYSAAAAELEQLLAAQPPDFASAVQVAHRLPSNSGLTRRVRGLGTGDQAPATGDTRRVSHGACSGRTLALQPGDETIAELLRQAEAERSQKLNDVLAAADAALAQDNLEVAGRLIAQAQKLDVEGVTQRTAGLEQRLRTRQPILAEMRQRINEAQKRCAAPITGRRWSPACRRSSFAAARRRQQLLADLRGHLRTAIDQYVAGGNFYMALQTCDLALQLGADTTFIALRADVDARHHATIDSAVATAAQALVAL